MSIIDTLITDRTEADRAELLALYAKESSTWTDAERYWFWAGAPVEFTCADGAFECADGPLIVGEGVIRGAYNASDVNRVQESILYLVEAYKAKGIAMDGVAELPTFAVGDLPTASAWAQYLANVAVMRDILDQRETAPKIPANIRDITVATANNIETIMLRIREYQQLMELSWLGCGEIYCGEV